MGSAAFVRPEITLDDKYTATSGDVLLSGIQALVRSSLDLRRLDAARGRDTGVFISGYQGSPLGGLDREISRAGKFLTPEGVVFRPGLNEELAATAVAGSQLLGELEHRKHDGVIGIWFGKSPGLDRAADAIRHANISGTAPLGGAIAWIGDDPIAKSSTVPSSCEPMCRSLLMPLLAPGSVSEILTLNLHAAALSRYAGLWTALKIVADVADASAVVNVDGLFEQVPDLANHRVFHPPVLLGPTNLDAELDLMTLRLARATEYAKAANLNQVRFAPTRTQVAIVAAGMAYQSLLRAFTDLGLDEQDYERLGIRVIQLGMPWPPDQTAIRELVKDAPTVFVIEDKLPFLEGLIKEALYGTPTAPLVLGKRHIDGTELLSPRSGLMSDDIIAGLRAVIPGLSAAAPTLAVKHSHGTGAGLPMLPRRTPAFCSGCPHSVSTRADSDQLVGVGIGCHTMVVLENQHKRGQLTGMTQMGGEGAQWLGLEPFTTDKHFFQNVGDGTFYHSGSLAIRSAVAARSNITYKLLFNEAVAMTGGQTPVGQMNIPELTNWLTIGGVKKIIITTAHPETWRDTKFGPTVSVRHRDLLAEAQRELEKEPGVTVLLHIDRCAAEERRLRTRGKVPAPAERIWINERVCEGCGDCGAKSTCLSVLPVETEFGRKTQIEQSSCNQDTSCLKGDCPSFIKVVPSGKPSTQQLPDVALPDPRLRVGPDVSIRMPGIGGTGVVTVSAILQMAAFMGGKYAAGLEQIGLAQKGGPVISDIRFASTPVTGQLRAGNQTVDVLIGFDDLGAASQATLDSLRDGAIAVINTGQTPTWEMVQDTHATGPPQRDLRGRIDDASTASENLYLDALALSDRFFADHMPANMILIGAAFQHGVLPLQQAAIQQAIRLNGAAVQNNLHAFRLGRIAVAAPEALQPAAPPTPKPNAKVRGLVSQLALSEPGRERVERLASELVAYQSTAYARRFVTAVRAVADTVDTTGTDGAQEVVSAFAEGLFKLMAYKDEFEVARLHLDAVENAKLAAEFGSDAKVKIMLHPPLLRALGWRNKIAFADWFVPMLRLLYGMRRIRGTKLDIFGRAHVREIERALPGEYQGAMAQALARLTPATLPTVLELAQTPDVVRGYEDIKLNNVKRYRERITELQANLADPTTMPTLAGVTD